MLSHQSHRNKFADKLQRSAKEQLVAWYKIASSRRGRGLLISAPGFSLNLEHLIQASTDSHHLLPAKPVVPVIPVVCAASTRCRWLTLFKEGSIQDASLFIYRCYSI